jgi:hypothetical protein
MTIYCHGMLTAQPREYLTLPAGDSENYAEIYDKRLVTFIIITSNNCILYDNYIFISIRI